MECDFVWSRKEYYKAFDVWIRSCYCQNRSRNTRRIKRRRSEYISKEISQLENKHANFRIVPEQRRSKKWQKFKTAAKSRIQSNITLTEKVTESRDSIKISSKQSGNCPNNGHNILTSRESSSNINLNKSLISGSSSNATGREEENHLNGINRFITDNRKTREKYKQRLYRTKETVTTVKNNNVLTEEKQQGDENRISYAEAVKYNRINNSNDTVNLSEIYNQFLEDELNNTCKVEISPPKVCTNSASSSNALDYIAVEDNHTILCSQDEEVLSEEVLSFRRITKETAI